MDIDLYNNNCEFDISQTGVLIIKLMKDAEIVSSLSSIINKPIVIGNIHLDLDDNDLMGLLNLIKNYFKEK